MSAGTAPMRQPTQREDVVMTLGSGWVEWVYEGCMVALAVAVVAMLPMPDRGWVRLANIAIWGIFVVDYAVRLALSRDRRAFARRNIADLVAILPLDLFRIARVARLARLVRLARAFTVLWRVSRHVRGVLSTNGLAYVLGTSVAVVLLGAGGILAVEPGITDLGDAIWWSVVTATTVGYGDIAPTSGVGRLLASALMVIGIGTIGMVTGSIATYFIHGDESGDLPPDVAHVRERLSEWNDLEPAERRGLSSLLESLAAE